MLPDVPNLSHRLVYLIYCKSDKEELPVNTFDKVIGYESIKNELLQICDMIHHPEVYTALGAKLPQGVMLYGAPGLGKTLLAKCFIEESGLRTFTVRRNKGANDFVEEIIQTFRQASANAPAIVFLDDMDKFANEDDSRRDAEEYVAVQSAIDEVKGAGVFVLATVNEIRKLPPSLKRSGRFDRKIEVLPPTSADAEAIIRHYLRDKKLSDAVRLQDVAMMITYSSCAELETILNESAIRAAYRRSACIEMEDITEAVLRMEYASPDSYCQATTEERRRIALHEAGHLVVCETLCPGSIGLISLRTTSRSSTGGFVRRCRELPNKLDHVLVSLGGMAATELCTPEQPDEGCGTDLETAFSLIRNSISKAGTNGLWLLDVETRYSPGMSESLNQISEALVHSELERYLRKAKAILTQNRAFLDAVVEALLEKETLLYSDIQTLRASISPKHP